MINPNYKLPYVDQFSLGVERATPKNGKLEVSYVGSRSHAQDATYYSVNENIPLLRSCDQSQDVVGQVDRLYACNQLVSNPFYGLPNVLGGLGAYPTTSAYQLARTYPEFTGITEGQLNAGKYWYNSLQTTYVQRVSWVQVNASWTWSKTMTNLYNGDTYIDEAHGVLARSLAPTDRAHRVTLQSVLYIPIGRGRRFFSGTSRPLDAAIGGWELGSDFFWESGNPEYLPTGYGYNLIGNLHASAVGTQRTPQEGVIDSGLNTCYENWTAPVVDPNTQIVTQAGFYGAPTSSAPGVSCSASSVAWQQIPLGAATFTQGLTGVLRDPAGQQIDVNLAKTFKFAERLSMQLRLEAFNVLNHPVWNYGFDTNPSDPEFGTIDKAWGQGNRPRLLQLGAKFLW
jgi:hypothetical protein